MIRIPLISGSEYDALTGWRRFVHTKPEAKRFIKRKYNKRLRQWLKKGASNE